MTIQPVPAFDAIRVNIGHLPHGQHAGYTTGGGDIQWLDADWAADPKAVRICQDAGATDSTADVLDIERGAATLADIPLWVPRATVSYKAVARSGQRKPSIYTSASNVTAVANVLKEAKLSAFLWMADWNLDDAQANADVKDATGFFPMIGVQWRSGTFYDTDVFSYGWLHEVSAVQPVHTGPYLHTTVADESLDDVAQKRHEGALALITYSAEHYTQADVSQLASKKLPAGVPYYTRNP